MAKDRENEYPLFIQLFDTLVSQRDLSILISQNLPSMIVASNFTKFYGTKLESTSSHKQRYIERLASYLSTNLEYFKCGLLILLRLKTMSGIDIKLRVI